ncbi:pyridoxamine 5'-phosphate oxidase family protein [soil metagenome]
MTDATQSFTPTDRTKIRLKRDRAAYDRDTVYAILDAALMCNVGYVIDGQPYVTPTAFWREGNHLYWHGSSASRALKNQSKGIPVCLTVAHIDGIVLARSGFHSSINYRAVMAFGTAQLVEGHAAKKRAMDTFMDRFNPGRSKSNRASTEQELAGTKVLVMEIDEASAKVRVGPPMDDDEDYELPVWAGVINFKAVVGALEPDPRNLPGLPVPAGVSVYAEGADLGKVLSDIYDGDAAPGH